jgi:alpha-beta hydrolase superfamily lysophospholipase
VTANQPAVSGIDAPWDSDILGRQYQSRVIPLGDDPDGEGMIEATLVRRVASPPGTGSPHDKPALLAVHGFTDYFFQRHLADWATERGHPFYALDLRKCGRSTRAGQTPHFVTDLVLYDAELAEAVRLVREDSDRPVVLLPHSTGGLVAALWLHRAHPAGVVGAAFNSPWLDMQGPWYYRSVLTPIVNVVGRMRPHLNVPLPKTTVYGDSIYAGTAGEWDFDTHLKPLAGFPIVLGWLRAIRHGHAAVHRGLDVGVPALVLHSDLSGGRRVADHADTVLDVAQIDRWSPSLGPDVEIAVVPSALHDVYLSAPPVRRAALNALAAWLDRPPRSGE